ncbi:MAG: TaqI-like C-terminal specificity domain-containing protein, partial [Ferruginibacter sp.]
EDARSVEVIKPFLAGREIKRFIKSTGKSYIILFPKGFTNQMSINSKSPWKWLTEKYSAVATYLKPFEEKGKKRYDQGDYWWELRSCDYYKEFITPKIMYAEIATKGQFQLDYDGYFSDTTSYIMPTDSRYLLGILNSTLVTFLFSKISSTIRGGFLRWKKQYVETIPIKIIDDKNKSEKSLHDEIVKLVDTMLQLQQQKQSTTLPDQLQQLQQRIAYTDDKINEKVYQLYGLSEEEVRLVEGR